MGDQIKTLIDVCQSMATVASIQSVLAWDQETYMPLKSIAHRSKQNAWVAQSAHEFWLSDTFKNALGACVDIESQEILLNDLSFSQRRLLQELWLDWKKKCRLPSKFVGDYSACIAEATHVWQQAKSANDYNVFQPYLEKLIQMSRQKADYLNPESEVYDVLLDEFEPGMTINSVSDLFVPIKQHCIPLLNQIQQLPLVYEPINGPIDTQKQWAYSLEILKKMGFDFDRGRQDRSSHPFTIDIHPSDVRLTTRLDESLFFSGLTSTVHEGGHGLYEQGLNVDYFGTPLGQSVSLGIHESQSRLWENHVCKSLPFWEGQLPHLRTFFPGDFDSVTAEDLWRQVNQVKPGFIRVDADELSYLCHIIIRFECEVALFDGSLTTKELPEFWNERYKSYLGITPRSYSEGVLQDIHWSSGLFGYFPTYVIGSICAAQLMASIETSIQTIDECIQRERWIVIKDWLAENIFKHGRTYLPNDLMKKVTGSEISAHFLIDYLQKKYESIYLTKLS